MNKKISWFNDYQSDCNHVGIGYDGTGDFLVKIYDRCNYWQYAIMAGEDETRDLIKLLQDSLDDFLEKNQRKVI